MFADLAPKLEQAARIEIVHAGKTMAIVKHGDVWGLEERAGYVVQPTKLRGMLTALTELRLVEPRTTDPAEFKRLGLEDPSGTSAKSNLLRVVDASGKPIVSLIVGHRRSNRAMCQSRFLFACRTIIRPGWRRAIWRWMPIHSNGSIATS